MAQGVDQWTGPICCTGLNPNIAENHLSYGVLRTSTRILGKDEKFRGHIVDVHLASDGNKARDG